MQLQAANRTSYCVSYSISPYLSVERSQSNLESHVYPKQHKIVIKLVVQVRHGDPTHYRKDAMLLPRGAGIETGDSKTAGVTPLCNTRLQKKKQAILPTMADTLPCRTLTRTDPPWDSGTARCFRTCSSPPPAGLRWQGRAWSVPDRCWIPGSASLPCRSSPGLRSVPRHQSHPSLPRRRGGSGRSESTRASQPPTSSAAAPPGGIGGRR